MKSFKYKSKPFYGNITCAENLNKEKSLISKANLDSLKTLVPENIDFESVSSYSLGVTVSDGTKTSSEELITINITDDPNAFIVDNFTVKVYRDGTKTGVVNPKGTSYFSSGNEFSYEIDGGNDGNLFSVDKSSGLVSFKNPPTFSTPLDSDSDNVYEFKVKSIVNDDTIDDFPTIDSEKTVSSIENESDFLTVTSILSTSSSDFDNDGILDINDNCPSTYNPDQKDSDGNGEGDVCEDSDGDGVLDFEDNCIYIPNPNQEDADGDGEGDVCEDADNDGIIDSKDNCINTANIDQSDLDGDGTGDVCDDDRDGDGIVNTEDNCPDVSNADQADADEDGTGDVCDDDRDGDGVVNTEDNCPDVSNADQSDLDGDGIGDVCDDDKDGDGVLNEEDNCPDVSNADQADMDGDNIGDVCDDDKDGDSLLNNDDNCPDIANTDQADADKDGIGDVCDSVFNIPSTNNKVSVTSSTCIGNTDGSIGLSVEDASYSYLVTVTGQDDPIALGGETKTASVTGLGKGTYTVCFTCLLYTSPSPRD